MSQDTEQQASADANEGTALDDTKAMELARAAYKGSTDYFDANVRKRIRRLRDIYPDMDWYVDPRHKVDVSHEPKHYRRIRPRQGPNCASCLNPIHYRHTNIHKYRIKRTRCTVLKQ